MASLMQRIVRRLRRTVSADKFLKLQARDSPVSQVLLAETYRSSTSPRSLRDVGFQLYSQSDEDGILLYVFARIGTTNKKAAELCAGTGIECNTANLILNHGWIGLLVDGNPKNIETARNFFSLRPETQHWLPKIRQTWLTADNVNEFLQAEGFAGDIDLLSLDVDGMDYWLWKSIAVAKPRVVVLEFNHLLGPDASLTVPYKADFIAEFTEYGADYSGASLRAFVELGRKKGYRFIGTNKLCTNAFFVIDTVDSALLPEADLESWFDHPRAQFGMSVRYPRIRDRQWQEV